MTGPSRPAPPKVSSPDAPGLPPAVRVIGYLGSEKGVGEGARATVRALRAAGVPFALETVRDPTSDDYRTPLLASHEGSAGINIVHINPKELVPYRERLMAERAAGRVNIGYWAWELPELPASWVDCLELLDEVWTPSGYVTAAVARSARIAVRTVPHCVELAAAGRDTASTPGAPLTFFFAFDHRSDLGRKNPLGVIEAFRRAFGPGDPVRLVLKSMHSAFDPVGAAAVTAAAAAAGARIIDGTVSRAEMIRLLVDCDCYVSLHRAEGFGLSLAEAMALGKPVVATGYSGNTDFMTGHNSLLVGHTLVPVGPGHGDYAAHQQWAEPDLDHAAALMREVADDPALAARLGSAARADIRRTLRPEVVGAAIRQRLAELRPATRAPAAAGAAARCSIVIPVYGRAELTRNCLRALLADRPEPRLADIVVVDDASPDDTPAVLREFGERIRVLGHPANTGFALSCNDGAAIARGDLLVFLNNDVTPRPGWLGTLLNYARDHPRAGIVGAKLLYPGGGVQHAGVTICEDHRPRHVYRGFPEHHPAVSKSRRFQVVTGACMLVRRALFSALGGFDLAYRNGFEDVELCLRAGELGHEVHLCADSVLEHHESATRHGRPDEELRNFRIYWDRWAHRVVPDELAIYSADGLVRIKQYDRYPLEFEFSPELGLATHHPPARPQLAPWHVAPAHPANSRPHPRPAPPPAPGR